jgi:hypothetical protein
MRPRSTTNLDALSRFETARPYGEAPRPSISNPAHLTPRLEQQPAKPQTRHDRLLALARLCEPAPTTGRRSSCSRRTSRCTRAGRPGGVAHGHGNRRVRRPRCSRRPCRRCGRSGSVDRSRSCDTPASLACSSSSRQQMPAGVIGVRRLDDCHRAKSSRQELSARMNERNGRRQRPPCELRSTSGGAIALP